MQRISDLARLAALSTAALIALAAAAPAQDAPEGAKKAEERAQPKAKAKAQPKPKAKPQPTGDAKPATDLEPLLETDLAGDGAGYAPWGVEVLVRGYAARADGEAFDFAGGDEFSYTELFERGVGYGVVAYLPYFVREEDSDGRVFAWGPMFSYDTISYGGRSEKDATGDVLAPDDLDITTMLVGGFFRSSTGPAGYPLKFTGGIHLGVGIGMISGVDAVVTSPSGTTTNGTLYDSTTTIAVDINFRTGISYEVHDLVSLHAFVFLGVGVIGAPEDDDSASNPINPANPNQIVNLTYGASFSVTFRIPG